MSLVRSLLTYPWEDFRTPSLLFDQDFGLSIRLNDLIQPIADRTLAGYFRPWRLVAGQNSGMSSVRHNKDGFNAVVDVQQFAPNEIIVKTVGDQVVVEGKHEDKKDKHGCVSRHFVRRYNLPKGIPPENVTSTLSTDGILTITAPKPQSLEDANVRVIPITSTGEPAITSVRDASNEKPTGSEVEEKHKELTE